MPRSMILTMLMATIWALWLPAPLTAAPCFVSLFTGDARPAVQEPVEEDAADEDPVERLEAWPELEDERALKKSLSRLRSGRDEAQADEARNELSTAGAMVAPMLLEALGKERNEEARDRIAEVLAQVVGAAHTRLLAEWFDDNAPPVRIWTRARAARFPDAGLAEAAAAAWAEIEARTERTRRKPDPEERRVTALLLCSTGSVAVLDFVIEQATDDWGSVAPLVREAFAGLRGTDAGSTLGKKLQGAPRKRASALLRLLAACGSEAELGHVGPFLDSNDNTLRVDAINACRSIIDGKAPLGRLSVFEAIELSKKWKERL